MQFFLEVAEKDEGVRCFLEDGNMETIEKALREGYAEKKGTTEISFVLQASEEYAIYYAGKMRECIPEVIKNGMEVRSIE